MLPAKEQKAAPMKSIIHIGPPKTGTTSIQQMLAHHEEALREKGIHYVRHGRVGPSHNSIAMDLRRGHEIDHAAAIMAELEAEKPSAAILSSELFFSPWVSPKLASALPPLMRDGATLIAYMRRHDLFFEAVYKQKLKTGQAGTDPMEFLAHQKPNIYRFANALRGAGRRFPGSTVIAREYSRSALLEGNVVADFAEATGLRAALPDLEVDFESNPSISYAVCCALGELRLPSKAARRMILRAMSAENHPNLTRSRDVLTPEQRAELLAGWDEDNKAMAAAFAPDRERFFEIDLDKEKDGSLSAEERAERHEWARVYVRQVADRLGIPYE